MADYDFTYTGAEIQAILDTGKKLKDSGYIFLGVATPRTNPGTPTQKVYYEAKQAGTYTNFGGVVLPDGISLLIWNGSWTSETVMCGDGGVFDISVYKSTGGTLATFADLAAALNGGNNIPVGVRKGGMSVKFVQSSDNKYVQYRLMNQNFSTTVSDWQGVDEEPTAGSNNLVKSGGINFSLTGITEEHKYINKNANVESASYSQPFKYCLLEINEGDYIEVYNANNQISGFWAVLIFNEDKTDILQITTVKGMVYYTTIPSGYKYLACNFSIDEQDFYIKVNNKIYNQNSFVINEDSNVKKITNIVKNVSNSLDFEDVTNLTVLETKQGYLYDNGNFVSNSSFTTKVFDVRGLDFIHIPVFQGAGTNIQQIGFFTKTTLGASMVDRFMVQSPKYGIFPVIGYNYVTITSTNELIADVFIKKAVPIKNKNAFDSYNGTRLGAIPKTQLEYYQEINGYIYDNGQYTSNASWRIHAFKLLNQERYISVEGLHITGTNILYAAFYNGSITSDGLVKGFNVNSSEDTIFEVPNDATIFCISSTIEGISSAKVYSFEMGSQFFTSNWKGKTALFYGDSVTEIGQYGDVVDGEMSYPYNTTQMGSNWQRRLCQALGIQKFYSRGIGSATWEHSEYVAYVDSTKGFLVERPIPFVDYDDAPEREGCTKVHFGLSDFDRIQAQIPESIRTEIDLIFMFDHNSTISSFTPSFVTENVIDTYWMAYEGNPFGGDYNTIDPSNAVLSTIMKLQIWCPNAVIVIGTPLSGLGTAGQNTTDLTVALDRQQTVNLTKEICQVMSIPCINVWGKDGINPLNRTQYITDGIHPYSKTGAKAIARTLICGLNNVYPKI